MKVKDYYHQHLTDDEVESTKGRGYTVHNEKPEKLKLVDTTDPRSTTPTYTIQCPNCGHHNSDDNGYNIWTRKVRKTNSRKLDDALDSMGDSLMIGFCCEQCDTDYELVISKRAGFSISLRQTGFRVYE